MNPIQHVKWVNACSPAVIKDNAAFTCAEIDSRQHPGFDYLTIIVQIGATDIAMAVLKVTESDTAGSGHTDMTGHIVGTSLNIAGATSALPGAGDDNKLVVFHINLAGKKRYILLAATAGDGVAGTYLSAIGALSRARQIPDSIAEMGALEVLRA